MVRGPMSAMTCGCRIGWLSSSPRKRRIHRTPSPLTIWSASTHLPSSGTLAICPPITIVAWGWCFRISRHIRRTLSRLGMIELIPMMSYCRVLISSTNLSWDGKSSSVQGAFTFTWISISPQDRWKRAKREGMLNPRHLVVKQLHRIDQAAAVLIVLGVRAENAHQQHARLRAERVYGMIGNGGGHEKQPPVSLPRPGDEDSG